MVLFERNKKEKTNEKEKRSERSNEVVGLQESSTLHFGIPKPVSVPASAQTNTEKIWDQAHTIRGANNAGQNTIRDRTKVGDRTNRQKRTVERKTQGTQWPISQPKTHSTRNQLIFELNH